jgi:hypothetical protein
MRPLAVERYQRLGAQTERDGDGGFLLAGIVDAKASMWDLLEQVARSTDDDRSGWDVASDPAVCRRELLPWAAQFYSEIVHPEEVAPSVSDDAVDVVRARVLRRPRWERGANDTIVDAMKALMNDPKRVIVRDRFDPANPLEDSEYHLQVRVRSADIKAGYTPEDLFAAGRAVKPGWVVLHTGLADERDYADVDATYASYGAVEAGNTDYADVETP